MRRRRRNETFGTERLVALSDGVFAIAATLLVLNLQLPPPDSSHIEGWLGDQLGIHMFGGFFAYVLSFVVVGVYWTTHHRLFRHIQRADSRLLWRNVLFLLFVALIPFPTAVLAKYSSYPLGAAFYAAMIALTTLSGVLLWLYATHDHRLVPLDLTREEINGTTLQGLIPMAIFLLSIPIAYLVNPTVAKFFWLLDAVFGALTIRSGHGDKTTGTASGRTAEQAPPAADSSPTAESWSAGGLATESDANGTAQR